jgi:EAL domain-containing protein (putative c-di-GMP-specific phosphodiesterase class I)
MAANPLDRRVIRDPLDYAVASRDSDVMSMVRTALDSGNAQLAFQPVVVAQDPRQTAFYEGLIRVKDATGRVIPAYQFMTDIEETEIGREIDCASLQLGIEMLRANPGVRLSINMSARSMADGKWRRVLENGLSGNSSIGSRLILEISEASAMQLHEVLIRFMNEMQPLGVAFALDDFGSGMTSFRHLKDFYFDMVKIDKCFIRDIHNSSDNQVLTESLMVVAQQLEMFAVAEGVESAEEAALLQRIGVDCLQGYFFGVPKFGL